MLKNNIILVDNSSTKDNYYKNVYNSFFMNPEYLIFYKYLKLKITIHVNSYFNKKIIRNITNLTIDLYLSKRSYYFDKKIVLWLVIIFQVQ